MTYRVPTYNMVNGVFVIMPCDIPQVKHLWDAFDNNETEISAGHIVRYCQEQGNWAPFCFDQIDHFYRQRVARGSFTFNRLVDPGIHYGMPGESYLAGGGWIIKNPVDGLYYVTDDFIRRAHRSATKN